jgi:ABC-type multidrug transport system fused ATPase/permease subunit
MDEAIVNLDNETAANIERLLLQTPGLTFISVTHRYNQNLLQKYDEILVFKEGTLAESGTFDALYDKKKYFYNLFQVGIK